MSRKNYDNKESRGFFKFIGNDKKEYKLTLKEKLFCEKYLEIKGNGTEAAFDVYKCKNMQTASAISYEYLGKPQIIAYIDLKLEECGFSDENVKKQHLFTLNQFADLAAKNKAIDMFYKLKGQYAAEKVDLEFDHENFTNEELIQEIKRRERLKT